MNTLIIAASLVSTLAGNIWTDCPNQKDWKIELSSQLEQPNVEIVTMKMTSPKKAALPMVTLRYSAPGEGVRHVWVGDYLNCDMPRLWPASWNNYRRSSQLAFETPLAVAFNFDNESKLAVSCSEVMNQVDFSLMVAETSGDLSGVWRFGAAPGVPIDSYEVKMRFDRRKQSFAEAARGSTAWISKTAGLEAAPVPTAAKDPLYSTWYAYFQDVHADELEREAKLAAELGMKTMILDDGWQKKESVTFYSATGDWEPVKERFPDMKAHVDAVHRAGLKYMIWYSVPYVGDESKAWEKFKDKFLMVHYSERKVGKVAVLDPRFPEVREHLIQLFERTIRDWGFDGLKLDFIDSIVLKAGQKDPVSEQGMAGRDIRELPKAVDRLMKDILARCRKINPDVLIEFRQHYMGPAILQYGNMIRAADAPVDPASNRKRIADLRLTSGKTAVHADMVLWDKDETAEGAAQAILNAIFGVVQYSVVLGKTSDEHKKVIKHWIKFSQEHRDALLNGDFTPYHPELNYPLLKGESAAERVFGVYAPGQCVALGEPTKKIVVMNATDRNEVVVDGERAAWAQIYDTFGNVVGAANLEKGLGRLAIPASGYAVIYPEGIGHAAAKYACSYLVHFGMNMWRDTKIDDALKSDPKVAGSNDYYSDAVRFDYNEWKRLSQKLKETGFNQIVIDLGEFPIYPSHPELAVKGSWSVEKIREELSRLRGMGFEVIPKVNFSAIHNAWMQEMRRKVSTPEYYRFCEDIIHDVCVMFDYPRLFHIGYDEEDVVNHKWPQYQVIRSHELWWHDFEHILGCLKREGVRPMMWADYAWKHCDEFIARCPKNVLLNTWYYWRYFDPNEKDKKLDYYTNILKVHIALDKAGFEQIPCSSIWNCEENIVGLQKFSLERLSKRGVRGYMTAPWLGTLPEKAEKANRNIELAGEAIKLVKQEK